MGTKPSATPHHTTTMLVTVTGRRLAASLPLIAQLETFSVLAVDHREEFLFVESTLIGDQVTAERLQLLLRDNTLVYVTIRSSSNAKGIVGGPCVTKILLDALDEI